MSLFKSIITLAITVLPCVAFAQVSNDNEDGVYKIDKHAQKFREGEIIVKLKASSVAKVKGRKGALTTGVSTLDKAIKAIGVLESEELMPLTGKTNVGRKLKAYNGSTVTVKDMSKTYLMKYDTKKIKSVYEAINAIKDIEDVEFAEPNYLVYTMSTEEEPKAVDVWNDPLVSQQWGLDALHLPAMSMLPKITTKRPIIAILDTGVDITHPDLEANIWTNSREADGQEGYDDDNNGFADDIHGWDFVNQTGNMRDNNGHGTHCAGIAAAVGNNGIGIVGANPDAIVMPITVMQSDGTGDIATIIKGVDYAVANGADILSMSIGTYSNSVAFEQVLGKAYANAILVAAAGNDNTDIYPQHFGRTCFPAGYGFVLGVQSCNKYGAIESYSNYDCDGPDFSLYTESLYNYELMAPGSNILSTYPNGRYKQMTGTSMSCPLVAGAISLLLDCKEYESKELLWGDLIHCDEQLNFIKVYLLDDEHRQSSLQIVSYSIDDSKGDNDGRIDSGETIDIYPVIRNTWKEAQNVICSISVAENEDPDIISILENNVFLGNTLSAYGKGVCVNPIKVKINDKCVDGRKICLKLCAKCDNSEVTQDIVLKAENAVEIGGMITKDLTLYPNQQYVVTSPLAVPAGVTLTVKPGTTIKFKDGTGLSLQYATKERGIVVYHPGEPGSSIAGAYGTDTIYTEIDREKSARLIMHGTPDSLIVLTKADLDDGRFSINLNNYNSQTGGGFQVNKWYYTGKDWGTTEYFDIDVDCDTLKYVDINGINGGEIYGGVLENCIIHNNYLASNVALEQAVLSNCIVDQNICSWFFGMYRNRMYACKSNFTNGVANLGFNGAYTHDFEYFKTCNIYPARCADTYSILSNTTSQPTVFSTDYPSFYGTSEEKILRKYVSDIKSGSGYGYYDLSNMLKRPVADAHGIVWKVVVNGYDAQDEYEQLPPLGVGRHKFEVYFNRPMDKSVVPTISMGVRPPYSQVSIAEDGVWNDTGDVYTAYLTITGKTSSNGVNRILVNGAQDDEFFEIPQENIRFNVNVQAAGSLSTGFIGEAGLGKVTLSWADAQNSFEDFLGYNLYRFEDPKDDSNEEIRGIWDEYGNYHEEKGHWDGYGNWIKFESQPITKVNEQLLDNETLEYVDYDVIPGTTYYYQYKVITTDLKETDPSNVVAVTPQTSTLGDANGSGDVDVADVITTVNYAAGQQPKPFIFEAADMNKDQSIDILDVIGIIKKITNPNATASAMTEATATYSIENGIVYVYCDAPLAGVQVLLNMDEMADITTTAEMKGFEQTGAWLSDNDYIFLGYNMNGLTLSPGKHAILNIGNATISDIRLSDANGHNISAVADDTVTKVDNMASKVMTQKGIFNLSGQKVSGKAEMKSLPKGVYIINGQKIVK